MDDYNVNVLSEAKNEYSSRLVTILTPLILEGIKSIFNDAYNLCLENDEEGKYLMTFQNFLSRVPKWNTNLIEEETNRIVTKSKCNYLEDLLTCVHITQLKILTSIRVSQNQKKIDVEIPKLQDFIHKCYTLLARKLYTNVYLYEKEIMPLTFQKNMRECEILCRECIFEVIREGIPIESILRAYIDETVDEEIIEEEVEKLVDPDNNVILDNTKKNEEKTEVTKSDETVEITEDTQNTNKEETPEEKTEQFGGGSPKEIVHETLPLPPPENNDNKIIGEIKTAEIINDDSLTLNIETVEETKKIIGNDSIKSFGTKETSNVPQNSNELGRLSFNNQDSVLDMGTNKEEKIQAPKNIKRLEEISTIRNEQRKLDEAEYDDDDDDDYENEKLSIMGDTNIKLDTMDVHDLNTKLSLSPDPLLNDVEILT